MKQTLLPTIAALFFALNVVAQNAEYSGRVIDAESKDPLANASVKYDKGKGVVTDANGHFKLSLPAGEYDFVFSSMGYKTTKWTVVLKEGEKRDTALEVKSSAIQIASVVTVSAYKKNAAKESVTTEVMSQELIKNTNSNDLGEVVNKTPGVLVQDGQISIRGGSSYSYGVGSRTAVLSDGLSMASADLGEGQSKMVPLSNVKQVEVIKGASSVVYGSSALNGVVNVVTQWPTDHDPKTEIEVNMGFYDNPPKGHDKWWGDNTLPFFTNVNFNRQQQIKQFQYVVSANLTRNEGYTETSDELREQLVVRTRYLHPKISGLNFGLNASFQQEKSNRFFISKDIEQYAYFITKGSGDNYLRTTIDPHVSYTSPKGHRITSQWRYMNIFRKGGGTDPNAVSHQIITDNQYQFRYKQMLVVTAGLPFSVGISTSNLYPGVRPTYAVAAYTQVEYNYKILSLQGGLRYEFSAVDTDRNYGFPYKIGDKTIHLPIFRAGMNIQAARATFIRVSWGQGYRIPSVAEKYISNEFVNGLRIIPNDTLKSETGWSTEIGIKQGFQIGNWSAYFDAALFYQQYRNFIEFQVGLWPNRYGDGRPIFPDSVEFGYPTFNTTHSLLGLKALNVENARVAGYEIELAGQGNIGPIGLRLLTGYTYNWPGSDVHDSTGKSSYPIGDFFRDMFKYNFKRVEQTDTAVMNNLLYYRLRHLFRADIEMSYKKGYIGVTIAYGSAPEKVPALFKAASNLIFGDLYALDKYLEAHKKGDFAMDIRAGININEHFKLGFIVKNVTNRYYALRPGKPEPQRNFTFQFKYTF